MNFAYRPAVSLSPETGDPMLILRPEIPISLFGPKGVGHFFALVDTGADNTIFPKSIADDLGISVAKGAGPEVTAFGGQKLPVYFGDVELEVANGAEKFRWRTRIQFFAFPSPDEESLILGHGGFLDYFTAIFDGKLGTLSLTVNDELPAA